METDLSKPFVIGAGNVLYLHGWCYHTSSRIGKLSILVNGCQHRVSNINLVRHDVFNEHFPAVDKLGQSLNSGFWTMIPFPATDCERRITLEILANLDNGEICKAAIGIITLEPNSGNAFQNYTSSHKESTEPLVAICMATYNPSLKFFEKQVESIIHQTFTNWICIISDDCSDPDVLEKMQAIVSADRRFKIFGNSSNMGFYHNFEKCLSYVPDVASFVALSDQDDYWHDNKLAVLLEQFEDKTLLVYSDMNIVNEEGNLTYSTYWTSRKNNFTELELLIIANTVTGAASMFRSGLLKLLLPFPQRIGDAYHDNFIACISLAIGEIKYVDSPLYNYRQHSANIFGHKLHSGGTITRNFLGSFRQVFSKEFMKNCLLTFRQTLLNYQRVYDNDYIRRVLIAHVLKLRCDGLSSGKRRIIERFVNLEKSAYGLLYEVAKNRVLGRGSITVGNDTQLLKSYLSVKLLNLYNRFAQRFSQI